MEKKTEIKKGKPGRLSKKPKKKGPELQGVVLITNAEGYNKSKDYSHAHNLIDLYVQKSLQKDANQGLGPVRKQASKFIALLYACANNRSIRFTSISDVAVAKDMVREDLGLNELWKWLGSKNKTVLDESGVGDKVKTLWYFNEPISSGATAKEYFTHYKNETKDALTWLKVVSGLRNQDRVRLKRIFMSNSGRWRSEQFFFTFLFSATFGQLKEEFTATDMLVCFNRMSDYDAWLEQLPESIQKVYGKNPLIQNCFEHSEMAKLIDFFKEPANRSLVALKGNLRLKGSDNKSVKEFRSLVTAAISRIINLNTTSSLGITNSRANLINQISEGLQKRAIHVVAESASKYPWIIEWCNEVQIARMVVINIDDKYKINQYLQSFGGDRYTKVMESLDQVMSKKDFLNILFSNPIQLGFGENVLENNKLGKTIDSTLFIEQTVSSQVLETLCFGMPVYEFIDWLVEIEKNFNVPKAIRQEYAIAIHLIMGEVPSNVIKNAITNKSWLEYFTKESKIFFNQAVSRKKLVITNVLG